MKYTVELELFTPKRKIFNEFLTLRNSCLNYIAAAHSCSQAVGNWLGNWKFSQFFFVWKILYRFLRKNDVLLWFSSVQLSLSLLPAARVQLLVFLYFLQSQRHENWRKYEVSRGVRLTLPFKLQQLNTHKFTAAKKKTLKSQKNNSEIIFATISDAFHLDGICVLTKTIVQTSSSNCLIFHKEWKTILIFYSLCIREISFFETIGGKNVKMLEQREIMNFCDLSFCYI